MLSISFGVAIAAYGEARFNVWGVMLQLAAVAFEATRLVLIQILLTSKGISLNPITSLYYVAPCCFCFLLVPWFVVEFPVLRATSSFRPDFLVFGSNSLCAFALNLAVFLLVGKERDYYGMLVEILELEYFGIRNKVVLFKCDWYDTEKGLRVHPHHGLVEIKYKSRLNTNEPFVLAQQAQQVYYMSYPSRNRERRDWWVVCKTRARSRVDLPLSEIQDENMIPMVEAVYQEDEISSPKSVVPIIDLDDPNVLIDRGHADIVNEEEEHNLAQPVEEEEEEEEVEEFEDELEEEDDVAQFSSTDDMHD